MHRQSSAARFVSALAMFLAGTSPAAGQKVGPSRLQELRAGLKGGVREFAAYVKRTRAAAPLIHSRWYVETMLREPPARLAYERAKREFGRRLLVALDECAGEMLRLDDSPKREVAAEMLLDLRDWTAGRPGYGNMLLLHRCQDIALVPLAHLIADLNFPVRTLDQLVGRLMTLPDQRKLNAEVLNTESPRGVRFEPGSDRMPAKWARAFRYLTPEERRAEAMRIPMMRTWRAGWRRIIEWRRGQGDKLPVLWLKGSSHRAKLPKDLQFFCDDNKRLDPFTTAKQWDAKRHYRLLLGLGAYSDRRSVESLLLFRKKVGYFPTRPPAGSMVDSFIKDPIERAFDAAWNPYNSKYGPIYGSAALLYKEVRSNTFCDYDTRRRKGYEIMHPKKR